MKKLTWALLLFAHLLPLTNASLAQGWEPRPASNLCLRNSQKLSPGTAAAGQYLVIYGPYSVSNNCAAAAHWFELRTQGGMRWPLTVEQQVGGVWSVVINKQYDPHRILGSGTFRMIIDNMDDTEPVSYKGSYAVPL